MHVSIVWFPFIIVGWVSRELCTTFVRSWEKIWLIYLHLKFSICVQWWEKHKTIRKRQTTRCVRSTRSSVRGVPPFPRRGIPPGWGYPLSWLGYALSCSGRVPLGMTWNRTLERTTDRTRRYPPPPQRTWVQRPGVPPTVNRHLWKQYFRHSFEMFAVISDWDRSCVITSGHYVHQGNVKLLRLLQQICVLLSTWVYIWNRSCRVFSVENNVKYINMKSRKLCYHQCIILCY